MAQKKFQKPSERLSVPDPDKIKIAPLKGGIDTSSLKKKDQIKANKKYIKEFTNVRIERPLAEQFKKYCEEQDIAYYGNYINAVLKAYINGDLQKAK